MLDPNIHIFDNFFLIFHQETVQRELIQGGAIPLLLQYIEDNMNNSALSSMATNAISCLIDIGNGAYLVLHMP